jgi:hypothetical protein
MPVSRQVVMLLPKGLIATCSARLRNGLSCSGAVMILFSRLWYWYRLGFLLVNMVPDLLSAGGNKLGVILVGHAGQLLDEGHGRP